MFKIKICGITNVEDAEFAIDAGADVIGVVCHAKSARTVHITEVTDIVKAIDPSRLVLLFVNAPVDIVQKFCEITPQSWLQFHGDEQPKFCNSFNLPYVKAVIPTTNTDVNNQAKQHPQAKAILCDGGGGMGKQVDSSLIPEKSNRLLPLILAGGLNPDNVVASIKKFSPDAVDVSSGVCVKDNPRKKDFAMVTKFISQAKDAFNSYVT